MLSLPACSPALPACRPLVFDLTLAVDNSSLAGNGDSSWRVLHVYGSPNPNNTALSGGGTIMKVGGAGQWGEGGEQAAVPVGSAGPHAACITTSECTLLRAACHWHTRPSSQINTLFPSPKTEEGIKGGVVLLRMRPPSGGAGSMPLQLSVTYTDREGKQFRCGAAGEEAEQCCAKWQACKNHTRRR